MNHDLTPLLEFIAQPESGGDFNIVWGGIRQHHRPKQLTTMTIGGVLSWQDSIDHLYRSEAAGKWQILEDTLRGLYRAAGMRLDDLYDEKGQTQLATALLYRRGLSEYLDGTIGTDKFAQSLSKEWASLPCITFDRQGREAVGQSYYAGDGLNKAHVSIADFRAAVRSIREPVVSISDNSDLRAILGQIHALTAPYAAKEG
ncbi:MAG: hypothetical protein ACPG4X_16450 [Pikeienuella sp.]